MPLSASAERRILVWRSEVAASAVDDAASSAASSTGSSSDAATSIQRTHSAHRRGSSIGRLARRLVRRLSGAKGIANDLSEDLADRPSPQTAMYRVPLPPAGGVDEGDMADTSSNDGKARGLKSKQERLERAARLLNKQQQ